MEEKQQENILGLREQDLGGDQGRQEPGEESCVGERDQTSQEAGRGPETQKRNGKVQENLGSHKTHRKIEQLSPLGA